MFVVINKNKRIYRFNGSKSFYLLSPLNPLRDFCIQMYTHPLFNTLIILTILINCIFLTFQSIPDRIE